MEKERNIGNDFLNKFCDHCNNPLKDEWLFCPNCKSKVKTIHCNNCGEELEHSWNYCPYCKEEIGNKELADKEAEPKDSNEWLRDILSTK